MLIEVDYPYPLAYALFTLDLGGLQTKEVWHRKAILSVIYFDFLQLSYDEWPDVSSPSKVMEQA